MIYSSKKICAVLLSIILALLLIAMLPPPTITRAESINYSGVLEDLSKDSSFKASNYPEDPNDYSIQLIQLAESVNGELFVYVYQPSGRTKNLVASSINISTTINDNISFLNYKLKLLNSSGTLYKYKVKDFSVRNENTRYYAITSLFRYFDENIDDATGNDNAITEVNYAVNKQYCFGTINGNTYVSCVDIETIVVTDKFVGFVRYLDGFKLYIGACDSHFVAFSTDRPIDKLLEADVYYTTQKHSSDWILFFGTTEEFGEKADKYAYLKYTDKVEHNGGGLFAGTYTWDRIQSVEDFISNENTENIYHGAVIDVKTSTKLTDAALNELRDKQWVLRFAETNYTFWYGDNITGTYSTIVGDVTILRLKFETDGITYNLGVIDNKQSGGREPSNETEIDVKLNNNGKTLLWVIMLIVLIALFAPILPYVINFIIWIVSLPFKLILSIVKKKQNKIDDD